MGNMSSRDPKSENSKPNSAEDEGAVDEVRLNRYKVMMERGGCAEAFTAFQDCAMEAAMNNQHIDGKCFPILLSCMEAHPDNYQPFISVKKKCDERALEEFEAFFGNEEGYMAFMEGGGCKEAFRAWENYKEEAEKKNESLVCVEGYLTLKSCMEAHSDYYQPLVAMKKKYTEEVGKGLDAMLLKADE